MRIYMAVQCHNFQRRICWSLSSIVQQSIFPFDIKIDIACLKNNGMPSNETIVEYYNEIGLNTKITYIDDKDIFAMRGLVRNIQIKNAINNSVDYIYFADSDHVYHPDLFKELICWLKKHGKTSHSCIFSRKKHHTAVDSTNKLINDTLDEMPYIKKVFQRASQLPIIEHLDKSQLAPGNMQIVAMDDVVNLSKGIYTDGVRMDSHLFKKGQRAWSDHVFRKRIGSSKAIKLPLQIHLNHCRDRESKSHIEVQR